MPRSNMKNIFLIQGKYIPVMPSVQQQSVLDYDSVIYDEILGAEIVDLMLLFQDLPLLYNFLLPRQRERQYYLKSTVHLHLQENQFKENLINKSQRYNIKSKSKQKLAMLIFHFQHNQNQETLFLQCMKQHTDKEMYKTRFISYSLYAKLKSFNIA